MSVDGVATAKTFDLSADAGSITVNGIIDASGATGGSIDLAASKDVVLATGSVLTAAGKGFNSADEGGRVSLEAGSEANGVAGSGQVDIQSGSRVDLSVAGSAGGTLHLRAPQNASSSDLAVAPINGAIVNASSIVVEGYQIFDASADGSIDNQEANVMANGQTFASAANVGAISTRLFAGNGDGAALASISHIEPGAEIINATGSLTLASDWDLSTYRFGASKQLTPDASNPNANFAIGSEPGILTLRAAGSIFFNGLLNDGFGDSAGDVPLDVEQNTAFYLETLLPRFADGTAQRSWSYQITSGADFGAADRQRILPTQGSTSLDPNAGSIFLGVPGGNISNPFGTRATVATAIAGHYQVIRTGVGSVNVNSGGDLVLLNPFATIYTAGARVADATNGGSFDVPIVNDPRGNPLYPAQYSSGGGDVALVAHGNIEHEGVNDRGIFVQDSERQLPDSWLYRRGFVAANGQFGATKWGDIASTTWWVDFSNFFEGVGTLGGGNVSLSAGNDVMNVDAIAATNARMPKGAPNAERARRTRRWRPHCSRRERHQRWRLLCRARSGSVKRHSQYSHERHAVAFIDEYQGRGSPRPGDVAADHSLSGQRQFRCERWRQCPFRPGCQSFPSATGDRQLDLGQDVFLNLLASG